MGTKELGGATSISSWRWEVAEAAAIVSARKSLASVLIDLGAGPDELFTASVVLGELLANAFMHGYPGSAHVVLSTTIDGIRISVASPGEKFDRARIPPDPALTSGRGFQIIDALVTDVAVEHAARTNTITATLRLAGE